MRRKRTMDSLPPLVDPPGFRAGHPVDPEPLPPHTDDHVCCSRCGHSGAETRYESDNGCSRDAGSDLTVWGERLHRKCRRCGFYWHEAVTSGGGASDG